MALQSICEESTKITTKGTDNSPFFIWAFRLASSPAVSAFKSALASRVTAWSKKELTSSLFFSLHHIGFLLCGLSRFRSNAISYQFSNSQPFLGIDSDSSHQSPVSRPLLSSQRFTTKLPFLIRLVR